MDEQSFVELRKNSWARLSGILDQIRRTGVRSMNRDQLESLGADYRSLVSDLAFARTQGASAELQAYLNELAGRAHGAIYAARSARLKGIFRFLTADFPALFRASGRYVIVAALILVIGCAFGVYAVHGGLNLGRWTPPQGIAPAEMSSKLMTNNSKVVFLAFAAGITAGLMTVVVLLYNGGLLGAVAASQVGQSRLELWTFVLPHGVIELTAICIAGGAGLMIGSAMIAPGNLRRADAVKIAAGRGLRLLAGTIAMLVVAATIEGFVSPSPLPRWSKFVFAALAAISLALYLGFAGRPCKPKAAPEPLC